MDSIKAQDIIRHIFKDEDKGVAYVTGLSITDGVEVLTKVLPELIKKAQEKNNVNDEGYFNEIGKAFWYANFSKRKGSARFLSNTSSIST